MAGLASCDGSTLTLALTVVVVLIARNQQETTRIAVEKETRPGDLSAQWLTVLRAVPVATGRGLLKNPFPRVAADSSHSAVLNQKFLLRYECG